MLDVITDIIKAEEEAKRIVDDANRRAAELKSEVEREERSAIESARTEAEAHIRKTVADAREEAEASYQRALQSGTEQRRGFAEAHRAGIDRASERIVNLLTIPAYE